MQRYTLTTAGKLSAGDRFYKVTDKNKTIYQVQELYHSLVVVKKDNGKWPENMKKELEVIFLRNVNQLV